MPRTASDFKVHVRAYATWHSTVPLSFTAVLPQMSRVSLLSKINDDDMSRKPAVGSA